MYEYFPCEADSQAVLIDPGSHCQPLFANHLLFLYKDLRIAAQVCSAEMTKGLQGGAWGLKVYTLWSSLSPVKRGIESELGKYKVGQLVPVHLTDAEKIIYS